jgi:hypothetical protein
MPGIELADLECREGSRNVVEGCEHGGENETLAMAWWEETGFYVCEAGGVILISCTSATKLVR